MKCSMTVLKLFLYPIWKQALDSCLKTSDDEINFEQNSASFCPVTTLMLLNIDLKSWNATLTLDIWYSTILICLPYWEFRE